MFISIYLSFYAFTCEGIFLFYAYMYTMVGERYSYVRIFCYEIFYVNELHVQLNYSLVLYMFCQYSCRTTSTLVYDWAATTRFRLPRRAKVNSTEIDSPI